MRLCFALILLASAPFVAAESTDFSSFAPGDVQGQNGFGYPSNSYIGGTIVNLPAGSPTFLGPHGLQLNSRDSSRRGVVNGIYTPRTSPGGGELDAPNRPRSSFDASIWYRTPQSTAP